MESPHSQYFPSTPTIMHSQHNLSNIDFHSYSNQKNGDHSHSNSSYTQLQQDYSSMYPIAYNTTTQLYTRPYTEIDTSNTNSTAGVTQKITNHNQSSSQSNNWPNYQLSYPLDTTIGSPDILVTDSTNVSKGQQNYNNNTIYSQNLPTSQYLSNVSNQYATSNNMSNLSIGTQNTSPSISPISDASKIPYNHFMQQTQSMNNNSNISNSHSSSYTNFPFSLSLPIGTGMDLNHLPSTGVQLDRDFNPQNTASLSLGDNFKTEYSNASSVSIVSENSESENKHDSTKSRRLNGSTTKPKGDATYPCETCGKVFYRPYNLRSHMKSHTTEKPFACKYCGKAFTRSHDRRRHERLHEEEKRFSCGGFLRDGVTRWGCNRKFARADALGRHYRTESGWLCIRPSILEAKEMERRSREEAVQSQSQTGITLNEQSIVDTIARQTANSLTIDEINILLNKSS